METTISGRFVLNKMNSFHIFQCDNYDFISILDFEITVQPMPEQDLHIQIVRKQGNTSIVSKKETMNIEAFQKIFYSNNPKANISFDAGELVILQIGAMDEKGAFMPLTKLNHLNNIENFCIDIGYELSNYEDTIGWAIV